MIETFSIEDGVNIRQLLIHHVGHPYATDDDDRRLSPLDEHTYAELERDLLRYCTRLRCQPRTDEHINQHGYHVPAHTLIGRHR